MWKKVKCLSCDGCSLHLNVALLFLFLGTYDDCLLFIPICIAFLPSGDLKHFGDSRAEDALPSGVPLGKPPPQYTIFPQTWPRQPVGVT